MFARLSMLALLATLAPSMAAAAPVFYCDAESVAERAEEIETVRKEILPGLKEIIEGPPGMGDRAHAVSEFKEFTARLDELKLGVASCNELRDVERARRRPKPPTKDAQTPPVRDKSIEDDLLAPLTPPNRDSSAEDDLLAPLTPPNKDSSSEDDLLAPLTPPNKDNSAEDDLLAPLTPPNNDSSADDDLLAPLTRSPR